MRVVSPTSVKRGVETSKEGLITWRRSRRPFHLSISRAVCVHQKICANVTWTRFWVIGDTILLHGRVYSSSAGVIRNLITSQEHIGIGHMQTYANKKTCRHMNLRVHNTRSQITRQELVFGLVDRQWDGSFVHCEGHNGLGCVRNMKVCALGSDSMLWEHNLFFNSWSSRSRSCDHPLLPCFHTPHFA